jgi:hypothetical protein
VAAKDAPDRARRDANAKASKLALDADTAPAPVLSGDPDDELDELIVNGRPTRATRGRQRRPLRLETSRCQQRSVSGVTRKERQRRRDSKRERAARIARSTGR